MTVKHLHAARPISPTYQSWSSMKTRCFNPNRTRTTTRYLERGITVCERWANSFEAFLEDMGERPTGTSLDRIDNNGNYEPGNCRWATTFEQASNTSASIPITIDGVTDSISGWARRLGISQTTIHARSRRSGVSIEGVIAGFLSKSQPPIRPQAKTGIWSVNVDVSQYLGRTFQCMTVISKIETGPRGWRVNCQCKCGTLYDAWLGSVVGGQIDSCGCETRRKNSERMFSYNASRRKSHAG